MQLVCSIVWKRFVVCGSLEFDFVFEQIFTGLTFFHRYIHTFERDQSYITESVDSYFRAGITLPVVVSYKQY